MRKRIGRTMAEWQEQAEIGSAFRRIASREQLQTSRMVPDVLRHIHASMRAVDEGRATAQRFYAEVSDVFAAMLEAPRS